MQPSPIVLVLVVLGMAAINAFGEELLWRGVLANSVPSGAIAFGYALQAITFGLAHFHGIPAGTWGIAISAVYSSVIFLFSRRYGPRTALATHFVTDVVLFAIMASTATFAFASLQ